LTGRALDGGRMSDEGKRKIPCEVYSRVVGYLRPVHAWNVAKRQEFADRVNYRWGEMGADEQSKREGD